MGWFLYGKFLRKTTIFLLIIVLVILIPVLRDFYYDIKEIESIGSLESPMEDISYQESEPEIIFNRLKQQPGGCFQIYIKGLSSEDQIATDITFSPEQPNFFTFMEGKIALVPISCRTEAGEYKLKVQIYRGGNLKAEKEETLVILPREFEKQYLVVSDVQQSLKSNDNLEHDQQQTERAKSYTSDLPLWEGSFISPVEGKITTEYGMIRYVNNGESSRHAAIDIAAAKGTPVFAANDGIVRLSASLILNGNTVIIDHGLYVYSGYGHLDKLLVAEGEEVKKGDIIGEIGTTGYSTGPHLHWTITVDNVYIDPEVFIESDPLDFIKDLQP